MGQNPTEEEIFQMISQVDDDNSGEIEFAEFEGWFRHAYEDMVLENEHASVRLRLHKRWKGTKKKLRARAHRSLIEAGLVIARASALAAIRQQRIAADRLRRGASAGSIRRRASAGVG